MTDIPNIISAFQCCTCGSDNKRWFSTNRSEHPFDSPGSLTCMDCGARFPVEDGYLNLQVGPEEPVVPFQKLMQMKAPVAVYEGIWRPLGLFHREQAFLSERPRPDRQPDSPAEPRGARSGLRARQRHATSGASDAGFDHRRIRSFHGYAGTSRAPDSRRRTPKHLLHARAARFLSRSNPKPLMRSVAAVRFNCFLRPLAKSRAC